MRVVKTSPMVRYQPISVRYKREIGFEMYLSEAMDWTWIKAIHPCQFVEYSGTKDGSAA